MSQDKPGEQKLVNSFILTDLEVCELDDTKYIELPKDFTHSNISFQNKNIAKQEDIQKWPYLGEVNIPCIDANVGLLIGTNNPKALEPWHIKNSQEDGPYAVKTAVGWVVNGTIKKTNNAENCHIIQLIVFQWWKSKKLFNNIIQTFQNAYMRRKRKSHWRQNIHAVNAAKDKMDRMDITV